MNPNKNKKIEKYLVNGFGEIVSIDDSYSKIVYRLKKNKSLPQKVLVYDFVKKTYTFIQNTKYFCNNNYLYTDQEITNLCKNY